MISLVKRSTTIFAVKGSMKGRKWAYLERPSKMTKIQSQPYDLVRPVIKSRKYLFKPSAVLVKAGVNPQVVEPHLSF